MPFSPMAHKTYLHHSDHIRIGSKNWLQGLDVLQDQLNGRVRVGLIRVTGGAGSGVIDKADDQLQTPASGGIERSRNVVERSLVQ